MKIAVYIIPKDDWELKAFAVLTGQLEDSLRKILKEIDAGVERNRFTNASSMLENLAVQKGRFSLIRDKELQHLLDKANAGSALLPFLDTKKTRQFTGLFPPDEKKLIEEKNAALVFIVTEFAKGELLIRDMNSQSKESGLSNIHEFNKTETGSIELKRFDDQILHAIKTNTPVGWINVSHLGGQRLLRHENLIIGIRGHIYTSIQPSDTILEDVEKIVVDKEANEQRERSVLFRILNFFSKQRPLMKKILVKEPKTILYDIIPRYINFAFEDGSISEPFPLYSMVEVKPGTKFAELKVALISNRHFELDAIVDASIIRNTEISRMEDASISDQEKLSFGLAERFFQEAINNLGAVSIRLYHTGLEPAVIGTYRALIQILLKKEYRGKIVVTPMVFKGGIDYVELKQWY